MFLPGRPGWSDNPMARTTKDSAPRSGGKVLVEHRLFSVSQRTIRPEESKPLLHNVKCAIQGEPLSKDTCYFIHGLLSPSPAFALLQREDECSDKEMLVLWISFRDPVLGKFFVERTLHSTV